MRDRKHHVQWNKDPIVQQLDYRKIGTYRPHYFSSFNPSNTSSGITTQTNLSLPELDTIQENSIISVEDGVHVPNVGDVHSSVDISQRMHVDRRLKSASMDSIDVRHTINPLHNSDDDSNIQISCTSKDELFNDNKTFQGTENPLHSSDEPNKQINGFVQHHTLSTDDDESSIEEGHTECAAVTNNSKNLSVNFTDNKDTSILTLAAVI